MRLSRRWCAALLLAASACGHAAPRGPAPPYEPTRADYARFAAQWPGQYEPNYLPFMMHRVEDGRAGDLLVVCRWDEAAMPLRVHVPPVVIPDALQAGLWPRDSAEYESAVREALKIWQRELGGLVRFADAADAASADIRVRFVAAEAPPPDGEHTVLGRTSLRDACKRRRGGGGERTLPVEFAVPEFEIYLADAHGLLAVDQVHRIALHEIGHALGMRGHSPIAADLMYEVARDRLQVEGELSLEDVNSFASLYRLPNGAIYGRVPSAPAAPAASSPGAWRLALAPTVDARRGFSLRLPEGWTHFETQHGLVAVDGVTWDYSASFQIAVQRYATIEAFLQRYGPYYLRRGAVGDPAELRIDGRRALRSEIVLRDAPRLEQVTLIEVGDGRLLVLTADCASAEAAAFRPVFDALLETLRIVDLPEDAWPARR